MLPRDNEREQTAAQLSTQDSALSTEPPLGRLRWDCRRGMLELDIVLGRFLAQHFEKLTLLEVEAFKTLLNFPDHDLWGMIQGEKMDGDKDNQRVLQLLRLC